MLVNKLLNQWGLRRGQWIGGTSGASEPSEQVVRCRLPPLPNPPDQPIPCAVHHVDEQQYNYTLDDL